MIRSVEFADFRGHPSIERNDCIVLRRVEYVGSLNVNIAFPFHEDTPNFTLTVPEALTLRNAIDDMVAIKMIGEPAPNYPHRMTAVSERDITRIDALQEEYPLDSGFDRSARDAIQRVKIILGIAQGGTR
ncbi:hypothetical protein SAMN02799630_02838 [Paenibacillus sp. UNCCL117]|uniref:hypothetical protein n=1 Tax=unclassified Paenibacillus TaxID=185978 RepID=UPI000885030E|nr:MULTISPECIES: hypothetical protein [unclassified Paenibacillus]SDD28507.1 hypothetical protein SAMN04488602_107153 [Paenibacillus sp. cl123]SFW40904.1 hypothetical protein SAMN02799630_02838 [Paenibacillus sp. UNCCL117]